MSASPSQQYAPWLWLLLGLFVVRVVAQPAALLVDSPILPGFESWHSGVLPYPLLVTTQILIIVWLARTARRCATGAVTPRARYGIALLAAGGVYFAAMVMRLVLGLTVMSGSRWFASPLPTFFHLVLASFLLLYGHFHWRYSSERSRSLEGRS